MNPLEERRTSEQIRIQDEHLRAALGPDLPRMLEGELVRLPSRTRSASGWSLHSCLFDAQCRDLVGLVARLHLGTPWWHVDLALAPSGRFAGRWGWGNPSWWRRLVQPWLQVQPRTPCDNVTEITRDSELVSGFVTCWRGRGHRGACRARYERVTCVRVR